MPCQWYYVKGTLLSRKRLVRQCIETILKLWDNPLNSSLINFQVKLKNFQEGLELDTREVASEYRLSQWTELVRQCRRSGQTVAVWCDENNINININTTRYYYWLKRIRKAACKALPSLSGNNLIVPVNIPVDTVETESPDQESSSDVFVRIGTVILEISNSASATSI